MFRYILFLVLFLLVIKKKDIIEGIDSQCCEGKMGDFTRGFHNSNCVSMKDSDGDNIPIGAPKPVARCLKESDRNKNFHCDGQDCSIGEGCIGCNDFCAEITDGECIPTLRKDGEIYKEGGYCINSSCESKGESECIGDCKWVNGSECKSKKFHFNEETKEELTKKVGTLLNYDNSENYKKYARKICDPFKGTKFEQGDRDDKWSDSDYEENVESFNYLYLVLSFFVVCIIYGLYVYRSKIFNKLPQSLKDFLLSSKSKIQNKTPNLKKKIFKD